MSEKAVFEVRPFVQNYAWGMRDGTGDVARLHKATGLKFLNFLRKTREKRHNITILMRFERKFRFGRPNSSLLRQKIEYLPAMPGDVVTLTMRTKRMRPLVKST